MKDEGPDSITIPDLWVPLDAAARRALADGDKPWEAVEVKPISSPPVPTSTDGREHR